MQDAGRGKVNIQAIVHVAHERPEHPLSAGQLHGGVERHRTEGHQHVGHRQRHDKVIGYNPANETKAPELVSFTYVWTMRVCLWCYVLCLALSRVTTRHGESVE